MEPAAFSDVTKLVALAEPSDGYGHFTSDLHPEWTIDGKPNGGYLLGLLGRAGAQVGSHPDVIAASAHYLRPPEPGRVTIAAQVLRGGRSATQLRAQLLQHDQVCVEALLTTATLEWSTKPYWSEGAPDPGSVRFEDAVRLPSRGPSGLRVSIMDQVDLRLDPESLGFASGRPRGLGELRGWLELPHGESFDSNSLIYAVDSFPPATLDIEVTGWVPTLELTAYVRALPAPGPVRVLHKAHVIDDQRVDEACWIWDSTGRLVAQGTQLAGIRLG